MNAIDLILIIPIAWFTYKGFSKGFIIEIASLMALLIGIYAAVHFSFYTTDFLRNQFSLTNKYMGIISFVLTFVLVILLVLLFGRTLENIIKAGQMGFLNKAAGALFGLFKVVFVLSILILALTNFEMENILVKEKYQQGSLLYKPIKKVAPAVFPKLKEFKNNYINHL